MIAVGQKVKVDPLRDITMFGQKDRRGCNKDENDYFNGVVTYVNAPHRWFLVEYGDKLKLRTGFKFDDIGTPRLKLMEV